MKRVEAMQDELLIVLQRMSPDIPNDEKIDIFAEFTMKGLDMFGAINKLSKKQQKVARSRWKNISEPYIKCE